MSARAEITAAARAARAEGLELTGTVVAGGANALPDGVQTLLLLSPRGGDFWRRFSAAPEAADGRPDPIDRWSVRVIGALAERFAAEAYFPFAGPPYPPFQAWAVASGAAFVSPVGLLVHDRHGLMISYRGALGLRTARPASARAPAPAAAAPCVACVERPCLTACPVGALGAAAAEGYDVAACKAHLATTPPPDCRRQGCAVRRACPLSAGADRPAAQSAFHMEAFL